MPPPFRIGVMQLTMEPLDEMVESARVMDRAGMDTIWLAEAYPWCAGSAGATPNADPAMPLPVSFPRADPTPRGRPRTSAQAGDS